MAKYTIEEPKFTIERPKYTIEKPSLGERAKGFISGIPGKAFRTAITPLAETITGKSLKERAIEATQPVDIRPGDPLSYISAFAKSALGGIGGEVADIATTPIAYLPLPIGRVLGKIPIRGTTLKELATKVPISKIFSKSGPAIAKYQTALQNLPARVAASRAPLIKAQQVQDPVFKVMQAVKQAGPTRAAQEKLFTAARKKQVGVLRDIGAREPGEAGFRKQLAALKGELPKVQFQGIRNKVTQTDIDDLYTMIQSNVGLDDFEKITAKHGLSKLFGESGGLVPTEGELDKLREVFSPEFIRTVLAKRPILQRMGESIGEVANIPRALMATFDMSAPLRQGVFFIGRPKQFIPAFGNMFKYFFSEKSYQGLLKDIKGRITYPLMKRAKLAITELGGKLTKREEAFMSQLPEKIPLFGKKIN